MAAHSSVRALKSSGFEGSFSDDLDAVFSVYRFDGFDLDPRARELRTAGGPVELRPCTFNLLSYLVLNAGRLISRDELFAQVWPAVAVSDGVLTQSIWEVRKALGEAGREPRFIRTVRGCGYCFIAPVQRACAAASGGPGVNLPEASIAPSGAGKLARLLLERAQALTGTQEIEPLLAAYEDLIAITQRLGLAELEVDARLARAACLLAEADLAAATTTPGYPPRAVAAASQALKLR